MQPRKLVDHSKLSQKLKAIDTTTGILNLIYAEWRALNLPLLQSEELPDLVRSIDRKNIKEYARDKVANQFKKPAGMSLAHWRNMVEMPCTNEQMNKISNMVSNLAVRIDRSFTDRLYLRSNEIKLPAILKDELKLKCTIQLSEQETHVLKQLEKMNAIFADLQSMNFAPIGNGNNFFNSAHWRSIFRNNETKTANEFFKLNAQSVVGIFRNRNELQISSTGRDGYEKAQANYKADLRQISL